MNLKKMCDMFCGNYNGSNSDLALVILRVVVGIAFIYHGWMKVGNMDATVQMFASMGVGTLVTYIASYVEFLGGVALLVGIFIRLVTPLLAVFMVVAIYLAHLNNGYNSMNGGYEYQLLLIASVIVVGLMGPGKYSLHRKFC